MLVSLAWALAVWVTGGFLWETSSFRLSSRDPFRPLVIGILSALAFWYAAPEVVCRLVDRLERVIAGRSVPIVVTAAALTAAIGLIWGTHAAGGADSYGYVSQADLWLTGHLRIDQRSFQPPVWPFDDWSFAPLGYKPGPEPHTIVPTYSSGLPLLMAGAKFVGGSIGLYSVVPLLGGLAVLLTFL